MQQWQQPWLLLLRSWLRMLLLLLRMVIMTVGAALLRLATQMAMCQSY
jgi:hypothetical protein